MRMISNRAVLLPLKPSIGPFFLPEKYSLTPCSLTVTLPMIEIRKTENFAKWIDGLSDKRARARIFVRIERLATGNPGDVKPVGAGVSDSELTMGLVPVSITKNRAFFSCSINWWRQAKPE